VEALGLEGDGGSRVGVASGELERQLKGEALVGRALGARDGGQPFEKIVAFRESRDPRGSRHLSREKEEEEEEEADRYNPIKTKNKFKKQIRRRKTHHELHEL